MSTAATVMLLAFALLVVLGLANQRRQSSRRESEADDCPGPGETPDSDDVADGVGTIAIEDHIDLHGFQPRDVPSVVESFLEAAVQEGILEVRLIHGRGKGVQRQRVQALLRRHPLVREFGDAPAHLGGWGATVVRLRPGPSS